MLKNINEELIHLWDAEQGQKKIRASLFSLILYTQKNEQAGYYQEIIKSVISKFPCRVIMIINDHNSNEYLKTEVSSETIGEDAQKIFCEIIQIEVAGKLIERVPYLILPHILPDLPIYLLWIQDPATESTILPHLEPLANRIVFDAESTENLQNYCRTIRSLVDRFHCNIGDLHWSALSGWRRIFAETFNDSEAFLSLHQSDIIRIQYNMVKNTTHSHQEIEAAYFQAWLASRLNWKFQSIEIHEGNIRVTYKRPMKEVIVLLTPQAIEAPPGTLLNIEIESAKNKGRYIFKRHSKSRQVYIQYSEKNFCRLPYACQLGSSVEGQEIIEEIFHPSGGKHYQDMLEILSLIPWRKG